MVNNSISELIESVHMYCHQAKLGLMFFFKQNLLDREVVCIKLLRLDNGIYTLLSICISFR